MIRFDPSAGEWAEPRSDTRIPLPYHMLPKLLVALVIRAEPARAAYDALDEEMALMLLSHTKLAAAAYGAAAAANCTAVLATMMAQYQGRLQAALAWVAAEGARQVAEGIARRKAREEKRWRQAEARETKDMGAEEEYEKKRLKEVDRRRRAERERRRRAKREKKEREERRAARKERERLRRNQELEDELAEKRMLEDPNRPKKLNLPDPLGRIQYGLGRTQDKIGNGLIGM